MFVRLTLADVKEGRWIMLLNMSMMMEFQDY